MGLIKFDHNWCLITLTVITLNNQSINIVSKKQYYSESRLMRSLWGPSETDNISKMITIAIVIFNVVIYHITNGTY